jgi:hypothetical protein
MTRAIAAAMLIGLLSCSTSAAGQEVHTYVGGGLFASPWGGARSVLLGGSRTFINSGPEAINVAVLAEAGWVVVPTFVIGAEVAFSLRRNPVTQAYYYPTPGPYREVGQYSEDTYFAVIRGRAPQFGKVRLAALAGVGALQGNFRQRFAKGFASRPGVFEPFGDERRSRVFRLAGTFGAEAEAAITPHLGIVPQFRVLVVDRGSPLMSGGPMPTFGFKAVAYRMGVSVWAAF